jgi:GrpB-like predicted nucleotidyltransferase (UPF0157 family)
MPVPRRVPSASTQRKSPLAEELQNPTVAEGLPVSALGLTRGEVRLAPADPASPAFFDRLAVDLRAALGELTVAVEHVGSTAVPGLPAKPIIDIAVALAAHATTDAVVAVLVPVGYLFCGDKGEEGGLLFVLEDSPAHRIAHVHAVGSGGRLWTNYIGLRDRLRRDAAARASYGELKRDLARQFSGDRPAYTAGKGPFISGLLRQIG